MQARAACCELQTPGVGVQDTRFVHGRDKTLSAPMEQSHPGRQGWQQRKEHIAWREGVLIRAFPHQLGGFMKSPHYPISRAAALTYLPFHLRWGVCHYLHQTAQYSLAPRVAVSQDTAQQYLSAGPPWPCDLALLTPLPWDPAAAYEGQTQQ